MRITFIIFSLASGGAERVMTTMANYWAAKGWHITLLTFDNGCDPPFYDLDARIQHQPLNIAADSTALLAKLWHGLWRVYTLRQAISASQPDIVISFIDTVNILTLLATRYMNTAVIVAERSDPYMNVMSSRRNYLRQKIYPYAQKIVVQSSGAREYFGNLQQVIIIPNPVMPPNPMETTEKFTLPRPNVMAIGRFSEEKRFDLLLMAFHRTQARFQSWRLIILGDGPLRANLETLRDQLGLHNQVLLPGRTKAPYAYLRQTDLFVLSSRFEGFPNALCEAMACGVPVIATDCRSGPREIVRDGVDGLLVQPEDLEALTSAMERLMGDTVQRQCLAAHAPEVVERFGLEKVMKIWERMIEQVLQ